MLFHPRNRMFVFDAPADNGAGGGSGTTVTDPVQSQVQFTPEQQARIDQIVKDRLAQANRATEAATEKARKDAEAKALKDAGEWQKLAETRTIELTAAQTKAAEADAVKAENERLSKATQAVIDAQVAGYPEPVKDLLKRLSAVEQLEWIGRNGATVAALGTAAPQKPTGPGPLPDAAQGKPVTQADLVARKQSEYGTI